MVAHAVNLSGITESSIDDRNENKKWVNKIGGSDLAENSGKVSPELLTKPIVAKNTTNSIGGKQFFIKLRISVSWYI